MASVNQYLEWTKVVVQPIAIIIAAFLTYRYAVLKLKKETKESLRKVKYEKMLEANQQAYTLLQYISDKENAKSAYTSIIDRNANVETFYVEVDNAKAFINQYSDYILGKGYGLFLSAETLANFAECRAIFYKILNTEKNTTEKQIVVKNNETMTRLRILFQTITEEIRESIEIKDRKINL